MSTSNLRRAFQAAPLDAIPPGLRFSLSQAIELVDDEKGSTSAAARELWRLYDAAEPWVGRVPELAAIGLELLDDARHHELRRFACSWLTFFPTVEACERLAVVARDESTPAPVREQATWSLGYRQSRAQPEQAQWSAEAIAVADAALVELAERATEAGKIPFDDLPLALRHVQSPALSDVFQRAPLLWGPAYEAFATPALARTLLDRLQELPNDHQLRAMRLAAATLGEEAVELLHANVERRVADATELMLLAITCGGEAQLPAFERRIQGYVGAPMLRQRARWHLDHPGVVPTVRALRTVRSTAVMPGAERRAACAAAADDLAALTKFARHPEAYLYTLWATMVVAADDPERARVLATAHPESRAAVRSPYLRDLARRGRAKQVIAAAQQLEGVEEGAYWLAIHGRPFLALELAATSRLNNPAVAAARVLALYRAGRPDLAQRVLAEELPPAEVTALDVMPTFPGDHERWMVERYRDHDPAIAALLGGMKDVLALAEPAPTDADPDSFSFETIGKLERWLARPIDGATVFLAGDFPGNTKETHAAAVTERGGRLVDGPFPGTHYYVMGLTCPVTTIAQLERQGTRRIGSEELGLSW